MSILCGYGHRSLWPQEGGAVMGAGQTLNCSHPCEVKFADFAPHMEGSNQNFAAHMEGIPTGIAPHMDQRHSFRNHNQFFKIASSDQAKISVSPPLTPIFLSQQGDAVLSVHFFLSF